MSTPETWGPDDSPNYPQLSLIESGGQESLLKQQVERAIELMAAIDYAQTELSALPHEAIIHAGGDAIARHYSEIERSGSNSAEALQLEVAKDKILNRLTEEELLAAVFAAMDQERSHAA